MTRIRPHTIRLAAEVGKDLTSAQNGGFTYDAVAQLYQTPNEHLMYFFAGSGAQTIRLRVPTRAIKIHDGHPSGGETDASVDKTVGFVPRAQELKNRMLYTGFISKTEEKIADKISDETINQNSMEITVLEAVPKAVDIDTVPEIARRFASRDAEGRAVLMGVRQYMWRHVGLVSGSSQGIPAILRPPTMVSMSGLPVSTRPWDAGDALDRLQSWAGSVHLPGGDCVPVPNHVSLSSGFLAQLADEHGDFVLAGHFAAPDDDGNLWAYREAIPAALDDLRRKLAASSLKGDACDAMMDSAYRQVGPYLTAAASADITEPHAAPKAVVAVSQSTAGPAQPPTVEDGSDEADRESAMNAHQELMGLCKEVEAQTQGGENGIDTKISRGSE